MSDRHPDLLLTSYDYELPPDRIAQNPVVPRDSSRLLVVDSPPQYRHRIFRNLPELLQPGDLLVLNNTRVLPARLHARTRFGGAIEVLLLEEQTVNQWLVLARPSRRLKLGTEIEFTDDVRARVVGIEPETGGRVLQFLLPDQVSLISRLPDIGVTPLPPYITDSQADDEQYQTVYADRLGSAAAPTAGLHFTPDLLDRLQQQDIQQAFVTLHVGVGTFRPVDVEDITQHRMHGEWVEVPPTTVEKIQQTQARGGRIIAVGTTTVRSLETAAQSGVLQPYCGKTELFIYPGYRWRVIDGLITNFHLPRSSLMMMISALIGRPRLLELYQVAIDTDYRFYSFGDAMLILPEAVDFRH